MRIYGCCIVILLLYLSATTQEEVGLLKLTSCCGLKRQPSLVFEENDTIELRLNSHE